MLRLTNLSNVYRKRTLRVLYGNTQAYPYAATLSANFDRTATQVTGAKCAILPGSVAVKQVGEIVTLAGSTEGSAPTVETVKVRPFGLFANFVGGELDELGSFTEVGVWRGVGSVYEILAPAFDSTDLSADAALETGEDDTEVYLAATSTGVLGENDSLEVPFADDLHAAARLISFLSLNAIIVELLV